MQRIEAGDLDGALSVYEQAAATWPGDAALAVDFGAVLWKCYAFDAGKREFDRALAQPGVMEEQVSGIARLFFEVGRYADAARAMAVIAERDGADEPTLTLYASALERDGKRDAAREVIGRALRSNPASARACRMLAHLDKRDGDYDTAVHRLQDHLDRYPGVDDWRLRYELGGVLDRLGRYDEAWAEMVQAKGQLAPQSAGHMQQSHLIRKIQWDATCAVTDADLATWYKRAGELTPPLRLALMAGFPRSGTTLLEQVVVGHPDAVGTDETGILGSQFITPLVWQHGSAEAALGELREFDDEQLIAGRSAYLHTTEQFIGESVGGRLLIEKEPLMTADLPLPLRLLPEASILMPLRDPRDVLVSYFFTMVPLNWNSAPARDIEDAAHFYADVMRHWLHLRDRLPNPWLEPRYEDLAADPEPAARKVAGFLGLGWDDALLDRDQRSERKAIRTPTYDDITKPITTRAVGRWKHYEEYLAPAFDILAPFIQAFGYGG